MSWLAAGVEDSVGFLVDLTSKFYLLMNINIRLLIRQIDRHLLTSLFNDFITYLLLAYLPIRLPAFVLLFEINSAADLNTKSTSFGTALTSSHERSRLTDYRLSRITFRRTIDRVVISKCTPQRGASPISVALLILEPRA